MYLFTLRTLTLIRTTFTNQNLLKIKHVDCWKKSYTILLLSVNKDAFSYVHLNFYFCYSYNIITYW